MSLIVLFCEQCLRQGDILLPQDLRLNQSGALSIRMSISLTGILLFLEGEQWPKTASWHERMHQLEGIFEWTGIPVGQLRFSGLFGLLDEIAFKITTRLDICCSRRCCWLRHTTLYICVYSVVVRLYNTHTVKLCRFLLELADCSLSSSVSCAPVSGTYLGKKIYIYHKANYWWAEGCLWNSLGNIRTEKTLPCTDMCPLCCSVAFTNPHSDSGRKRKYRKHSLNNTTTECYLFFYLYTPQQASPFMKVSILFSTILSPKFRP